MLKCISTTRLILLVLTGILLFPVVGFAGADDAQPEDMRVIEGFATFERVSEIETVVTTATPNTIVEFGEFSVGASQTFRFVQPTSDSMVMARVTGTKESHIAGSFFSNGGVILVNPNGTYFAATADVRTGSFVATTLDISNELFRSGQMVFEGTSSASVRNDGKIQALNDKGYVALIAKQVANGGIIEAKLGTVVLGSAQKATLSLDPSGRVNFVINEAAQHQLAQGPLAANTGTITAGRVLMDAKTMNSTLDVILQNSGVIRATRLIEKDGVIELVADNGSADVSGELVSDAGAHVAAAGNVEVAQDLVSQGSLVLEADSDKDGEGSIQQDAQAKIAVAGDLTLQASGTSQVADLEVTGTLSYLASTPGAIYKEAAGATVQAQSLLIGEGVTLDSVVPIYSPDTDAIYRSTLFEISRDWTNLGSFIPGTSQVEFVSSAPSIVLGSNTFFDFYSIAPEKTISFESGKEQQFTGTLTLQGSYGKLLNVKSTQNGIPWMMGQVNTSDIKFSSLQDTIYVYAHGPPALDLTHSKNLGNNSGFSFQSLIFTGASSALFDDAANWSGGFVPTLYDNWSITADASNPQGNYVYLEAGKTYTFLGRAYMKGAPDQGEYEFHIKFRSLQDGVQYTLNLQNPDFDLINLKDANFTNYTFIPHGVNAGNNTNVLIDPTWDGGGNPADHNWSTAQNWSGNNVPTGTDAVLFDGTSTKDVTIDNVGTWSGGTFTIASGYTGTITQAAAFTASTFSQADGTFVGGSQAINVTSNFTLSGGTFTSTSGTLSITGNLTITAGTFNHNDGTIAFGDTDGRTITAGSAILNDVTWNVPSHGNTIAGTMDIDGDFTILGANQINGGTITIAGNLTTTDTVVMGSASIVLNGSNNQLLSAGGASGAIPNLTINKTGGTLTIQDTISVYGNWTYTAGTVDAGTSTVQFTDVDARSVSSGAMSFNNVIWNVPSHGNTITGTMDINGNFTITAANQINGGTITVAGNLISADTAVNGSTAITLDGTGAQNLTLTGDGSGNGDLPNGTVTINKASGTVTMTNHATAGFNTAGQDLTITSGTLSLAGYNLTVNDVFTLGASGTLQLQGGETVSTIDTVTAGSTVIYVGTGSYTTSLAAGNTYSNLTFNGAGGTWEPNGAVTVGQALTVTSGTFNADGRTVGVTGLTTVNGGTYQTSTATQTLGGGLTVSSGTLTGSSGTVDVNGDLTLSNGTLTAPSGTMTVSGNFAHSGGTFTHNSGTVTLDGTNQTVSGNTTFYNLTKTDASNNSTDVVLTFAAGSTTTISGLLTLTGIDADDRVNLVSSSSPTEWNLVTNGTLSLSWLEVTDSDASGSTAIAHTNTISGGNNTGWNFGTTYTGTVYTDEGVTNIGAGKTIAISVNGGAAATADTNGSGVYSIEAAVTVSGDILTIYIDGEAEVGVTITITDAVTLTGLDIYQNRLILRHETAGPVTNTTLDTANDNGDTDIEALYTVAAGVVTAASGKELFIRSGSTYTPGAAVNVDDIDINGTFTMGANTITVTGTWDATGGAFTSTGTVVFAPAGAETILSNGQSFNNVYINDGLIGYWKLDGNVNDSSGYGKTGTVNGDAASSTNVPSTNFGNSNAYTFDGTGDYVDLGALTLPANLTMSAWVYLPSLPGAYRFFASSDDATGFGGVSLGVTAANVLYVAIKDGYREASAAASAGTWYHVAVTGSSTAGTPELYLNGVLQSGNSGATSGAGTAGSNLYIGGRPGASPNYVNGVVDDLRLYNRALTAQEIQALALGNNPGTSAATTTLEDTLNVDGNLVINTGTLDTKSGENNAITVAGSFINNGGKFTPRSGTVTLDGTAASKELQSGGQSFNNLTINGTGGSWALRDRLDVDGTLTITNGTLDVRGSLGAANADYTIHANTWTQTGGTFTARNGTVVLDKASNGTFTPSSSFNILRIEDPTENGLVGYWKFDEENGTVAYDQSGNGNSGTLTNTPFRTESVGTIGFDDPYALSFDGTNDYVVLADLSGILTSSFTISFWTQLSSSQAGERQFFSSYTGATAEVGISLVNGKIHFYTAAVGSSNNSVSGTTDLNVGQWYLATLVFDNSTKSKTIYLNGTSENSQSTGVQIVVPSTTAYLGDNPGQAGNRDIHALMDDIRIYNRALDATEVANLAAGRYASGSSSTATQTLGGNLTAATLALDSGSLSTSTYTTAITNALTLANGNGSLTQGSGTMTLTGGLTVSGSTYTGGSGRLDINNNFTLSSGTFTAPSGTMSVSGAFTHSGGTFTHNSGSVVLDNSANQNLSLSAGTTFNNLYINDGLVGYWKLNGDLTDASGYGNNGSAQGAVASTTNIPSLNFSNPNAYTFDITGDYISITDPSSGELDFGTSTFSFSVWVRHVGLTTEVIFDKSGGDLGSSGIGYELVGLADGSYHAWIGAGATTYIQIVSTAVAGSGWHHVAGVWDRSTPANSFIFVDGVNRTSAVNATIGGGDSISNAQPLAIGAESDAQFSWTGQIDDIRFYNRALSQQEIQALSVGNNPGASAATTTLEDTLNVDGNLVINSGTLDTKSGENNAITVAGSFINNGGKFTSRSGTVTLDGTAASKELQSGGQSFNNLTVNGIGGSWALRDRLDVDGTLTITNGTLDVRGSLGAANADYTIHANTWTQTGGTFTARNGTVVLDKASNGTFTPSSSFNILRIEDPTENGLVGYWKFDEENGTVAYDQSGNGNNGTLTNAPFRTEFVGTTGYDNPYSMSFDGADDVIRNLAGSPGTASEVTVAFWANPSANPGTFEAFFSLTSTGNNDYQVGLTLDMGAAGSGAFNHFNIEGIGMSGQQNLMTSSFAFGTWHHFVAVIGSGVNGVKLYVDGTLQGQRDRTASTIQLGEIRIGGRYYSGSERGYMNGYMDDVRIYNRTLDATEVANLAAGRYAAGSTGTATQTLGANLSAATLALDSGNLSTSTFNAAITNALTLANGNGSLTQGSGTMTLTGGLTVSGSTYTGGSGRLDINNNFTLSSGTFTAPSGTMSVSGAFTHSGGTFTHNSGSVVLDNSANQNLTLTGGTAFNSLYINDGLVGYWKFDGNTNDSSGYAVTTTPAGAAGANNTPQSSTNVPGLNFSDSNSYSFDGTDDYFELSLNLNDYPSVTFSAWVYADNGGLLGIMGNDAVDWGRVIRSDGSNGLQVLKTNTLAGNSSGAFPLNTWTHVAATWSTAAVRLYINGALDLDAAGEAAVYNDATFTRIGNTGFGGYYLSGRLDDVRFYNRVLSHQEIQALAVGNNPGTSAATTTLEDTLNVDGNLVINSGTLDTKTGENNAITVAGSFINNGGKFTPRSGTVTLDGTAASKELQSGGQSFNNLTVNGIGGSWALRDRLDVDGTLTITNGTLDVRGSLGAANADYTIHANTWTQTGGTFTARNGTVVLDKASNGTFTPSSSFNILRIEDPTENGLVGYWKFDEENGTVAYDQSGNGNSGTLTNTPFRTESVGTVGFDDPYALSFDGTNDYLVVSDSASLDVTAGLTLSAWIRITVGSNGFRHIISKPSTNTWSGNYAYYSLRLEPGGRLDAWVDDPSVQVISTAPIAEGAWTHVTFTFDGSTERIYINGVENNTRSYSSTIDTSNQPLAIGVQHTTDLGAYFNGSIDDIRIYDRALTSSEVANLASGRYASGSSSTATQTLGGNLTAATLALDSGSLNTSTYTAAVTNAMTLASGNGSLTQGSGMMTLTGGLTVSGGTYTGGSGRLDINNNFTLSSGSFTAPSGTMSVSGAFTHSGGTFNHNSGSVVLDNTSDKSLNLSAGTTFNNLYINDGLVGYWKFNGGLIDASGYGNTGTATGAAGGNNTPQSSATVPTVNFANGNSYDFDGNDDRVIFAETGDLDLTTAITISVWFRPDVSMNNYQRLVEKEYNTSWALTYTGLGDADDILFEINDDHGWLVTTGNAVTAGSWNHVVATYDKNAGSNQGKIYLNGTLVATGTKTDFIGTDNSQLRIGAYFSGTNAFDGSIDEVRIYNRALSAGEVTALAAGNQPSLSAATTTLEDALDVNGNLVLNTGTLDVKAAENNSVNVAGNWENNGGVFTARNGTVTLDAAAATKELLAGSSSFYNLTLNDGGGTATWELQNALDVNNNLTITGGTLDVKSGKNYQVNVAGNWSNSDIFLARSGTVILDGSDQTLSGDNTFYNLTKNVSSVATLTFTAGSTQTITNTLDLQGAVGNLLSLRSSVTGTPWLFDPQGTRTIEYLDVKDSTNSNAVAINALGFNSMDSGNNINWIFSLPSTAPGPVPPPAVLTSEINQAIFTIPLPILIFTPQGGEMMFIQAPVASGSTGSSSLAGSAPAPIDSTSFEGMSGSSTMPPAVSFEGMTGSVAMPPSDGSAPAPAVNQTTIHNFFANTSMMMQFTLKGGWGPFEEMQAEIIMPLETFSAEGGTSSGTDDEDETLLGEPGTGTTAPAGAIQPAQAN